MTLTEVNHVITEICLMLENMPETVILTDPVKKELAVLIVKLRLEKDKIETSA